MPNEIENEAMDLMTSASKAVRTNEAIIQIQMMPEVNQALNNIIEAHRQSPYTIIACGFLLGLYMGLEYHDIKKFTGE